MCAFRSRRGADVFRFARRIFVPVSVAVATLRCRAPPVSGRSRGAAAGIAARAVAATAPAVLLRRLRRRVGLVARARAGALTTTARSLDPASGGRCRPRIAERRCRRAYTSSGDGTARHRCASLVDGLHCAACVWLIESALGRQPDDHRGARQPDQPAARAALARRGGARRARLVRAGPAASAIALMPYDAGRAAIGGTRRGARTAARAGGRGLRRRQRHAAVGLGLGRASPARWGRRRATCMHWLSALIALPAIAYAGAAVLPLGCRPRSARAPHQYGRADLDRRHCWPRR